MPGLLSMEQQPSDIASATQFDVVKSTTEEHKTNGDVKEHVKRAALPPLDDSWRSSPHNVSLGKLLSRLAEGCFADLTELMNKLNGMQLESVNGQVNGTHASGTVDNDPISLKKKTELMNFAKEWRERFIKARIISDWARSSGEDVARTIDLRNTLDARMSHIHSTLKDVFDLKQQTPHLRMPQPNIQGAMQYLTTGESSYPDLSFIVPPPLTARQVLNMTHEMEVTANLRIWLNEPKLPYYMSEYRLENGRVAWICPGEFEVDLAVVDQLPENSPWYFVDLRPLFTPTPTIPQEARFHLEQQINAAAAANSLQGVYDFCHNYILDYKITELESQAIELTKGRFFDTLRVQRLRRNLTVQYWTSRGGHKSWLELGVHSGRGSNASHEPVRPANHVRWFRDGKLVEDVILEIDWTSLSLERVLVDVQAKHSVPLLKTISDNLSAKKIDQSVFRHSLDSDESDSGQTVLRLSLPQAHPACVAEIKISVAPYTGQWMISPSQKKLDSLQASITKNPTTLTANVVESLACDLMQDGLEFEGGLRSWKRLLAPSADRRALKTLFDGAVQITMWRTPSEQAWPDNWAIAYSTSFLASRWWTVRISPDRSSITEAHRLVVQDRSLAQQILQVEQTALREVELIRLKTHNTNEVTYHVETTGVRSNMTRAGREISYYLFVDQLLKTNQWPKGLAHFWSRGIVRIVSSTGAFGRPRQDLRISILPGKLAYLRAYLAEGRIKHLALNSSHGLAINFDIEPNMDVWSSACLALVKVARLDRTIAATKSIRLAVTSIGLDHIFFSYGPDLSAQVLSKGINTELQLLPAQTNPQQRVRSNLQHILNSNGSRAFESFAHVLLFTLPALSVLSKLDTIKNGLPLCAIHTRNISWYSIKYNGDPGISFTLRAREHTENETRAIRWHLATDRAKPGSIPLPEELVKALQDLWTNPGAGCESLRNGLIATPIGMSVAMEKLHDIVLQHVTPPSLPEPVKDESSETEKATAQQLPTTQAGGDVIMLD